MCYTDLIKLYVSGGTPQTPMKQQYMPTHSNQLYKTIIMRKTLHGMKLGYEACALRINLAAIVYSISRKQGTPRLRKDITDPLVIQ